MTVVWTTSPEERAFQALVDRLRTPRHVRVFRALRRVGVALALLVLGR